MRIACRRSPACFAPCLSVVRHPGNGSQDPKFFKDFGGFVLF